MTTDLQHIQLLKKQILEIGKEVRFLEFKSNYQDSDRLGKYVDKNRVWHLTERKDT